MTIDRRKTVIIIVALIVEIPEPDSNIKNQTNGIVSSDAYFLSLPESLDT
ncbi:MAG: hypothetical protein BWX58_00737 [Deltaproteobacteria bacterium ADurb.Bin026]|nr:MAG: hypothetical protein BWX58_00737 [Deltaproteobacteria bacterium ADurb.Bin026]